MLMCASVEDWGLRMRCHKLTKKSKKLAKRVRPTGKVSLLLCQFVTPRLRSAGSLRHRRPAEVAAWTWAWHRRGSTGETACRTGAARSYRAGSGGCEPAPGSRPSARSSARATRSSRDCTRPDRCADRRKTWAPPAEQRMTTAILSHAGWASLPRILTAVTIFASADLSNCLRCNDSSCRFFVNYEQF